MQTIVIKEQFPFSVEKLFNYLKKHENFEEVFGPIKVQTIQEGKTEKYGEGSIRKLWDTLVPAFEETVTEFEENKLIAYKITKGTPLKNHYGKMVFSSNENGSELYYTIEFESSIPLVALIVKKVLENSIRSGLKRLKGKQL